MKQITLLDLGEEIFNFEGVRFEINFKDLQRIIANYSSQGTITKPYEEVYRQRVPDDKTVSYFKQRIAFYLTHYYIPGQVIGDYDEIEMYSLFGCLRADSQKYEFIQTAKHVHDIIGYAESNDAKAKYTSVLIIKNNGKIVGSVDTSIN